jgi:hypothetical protein
VSESPTRRPALPVIGALLLALAAVGVGWWAFRPAAPLPVTSLQPDPVAQALSRFPSLSRFDASLASYVEAMPQEGSTPVIEAERALVATYGAFHVLDAAARAAGTPPTGDTFEAEALRFVETWGREAFAAAGLRALGPFNRGLAGLLTEARERSVTVSSLLEPANPDYERYVEALGDFVTFGLQTGMILDDGTLTVPPAIVSALFLYRWHATVASTVPVEGALPAPILQAVYRWRIEAALGLSIERRRSLAHSYAAMFPDDTVPGLDATLAILEAVPSAEPVAQK